jgi:hypothetical protein
MPQPLSQESLVTLLVGLIQIIIALITFMVEQLRCVSRLYLVMKCSGLIQVDEDKHRMLELITTKWIDMARSDSNVEVEDKIGLGI